MAVNIGDPSVRYNGRTVKIDLLINTDEPVEVVLARLLPIAKGPKQCMVLGGGGELDTKDALQLWEGTLPHIKDYAKRGGGA